MEYQPCVASGNKKAARTEAAVACLQELTMVPGCLPTLPPPQMPPALPGALRSPQPSQPHPKPVRPLMALQPRPQFSSLFGGRLPHPATAAEPPPPGVDDPSADFTSNVFEDLRKFESGSTKPVSTDRTVEPSVDVPDDDFTTDELEMLGSATANLEPQKFTESSMTGGLLGDAPSEPEPDHCEYSDDVLYDGSSAEYNDFSGGCPPPFSDMPGFLTDPEFFDEAGAQFGKPPPGPFYAEWVDFSEDSFVSEGDSFKDAGKPYDSDSYGPCGEFEADFANSVGFGRARGGVRPLWLSFPHRQRGPSFRDGGFMRVGLARRPPMGQAFRPRGPRPPLIACPPPRRLLLDTPPQQLPEPSFDVPPRGRALPLSRGVFRPRMRLLVRPFPPPQ